MTGNRGFLEFCKVQENLIEQKKRLAHEKLTVLKVIFDNFFLLRNAVDHTIDAEWVAVLKFCWEHGLWHILVAHCTGVSEDSHRAYRGAAAIRSRWVWTTVNH